MNPATAAVILLALEELIKVMPTIVPEVQKILSKSNATPEDWNALRTKVLAKTYEDFVPDSKIPKV